MASSGKAVALVSALNEQAKDNSRQTVRRMQAADRGLNATLVGDPEAGSQQIPAEDVHPYITDLVRLEVARNFHKILSVEVKGVAKDDYDDILALVDKLKEAVDGNEQFMADARARIKLSRGQLADVIQTNAPHMSSGNALRILTANEFSIVKSFMQRAGTSIRWEAPLILDNAHTRIMLAHSLVQEAELLTQRAVNILATVKEVYGIAAEHVSLLAKQHMYLGGHDTTVVGRQSLVMEGGSEARMVSDGPVIIKGQRVDINPDDRPEKPPYTLPDDVQPSYRTNRKKHLELPQWAGMSPIPAYVSPDDEVALQQEEEESANG